MARCTRKTYGLTCERTNERTNKRIMNRIFESCFGSGKYEPEPEVENKLEVEVLAKTDKEKVAECQAKYNISDEKVQEFQKSFTMLDKDGNEKLDTSELGNAMHFWGENPTSYEIQALIKQFDHDGNGTIEFPEYLVMMVHRQMESDTEKKCTISFSHFDSNKSGYITLEDTKKGLEEQSLACSDQQLTEITTIVEKNADGDLKYSQVVKLLRKKGILTLKDGI